MHPILFRIPLPNTPLKLWWLLVGVAVIGALYAAFALRQKDKQAAFVSAIVTAIAGALAYHYRETTWQAPNLPIYSYGVMLGLSLVVGWYLSLNLAEREGLDREVMANCYLVTAFSAIVGSRLLYVVTNLPEFEENGSLVLSKVLSFRSGGLVAYGGFLGGFLGSWLFLASRKIRLLPWGDAVVPSLASGLLITRIGCYLYGCDFGARLSETAPSWLRKAGTFPHWAKGTLEQGEGAPAFVKHMGLYRGSPLGDTVLSTNASLPVHPTQLYESLTGLALLVFLLMYRKHVKFRGQLFFLFTFAYGAIRFLLEILRDDEERGSFGPTLEAHIMIPGALTLLALGYLFGISLSIKNTTVRSATRVLAFAPALIAFVLLRPANFVQAAAVQLSTSQWIALVSAMLVAAFYAKYWDMAQRSPAMAMELGEGAHPDSDDGAKDEQEQGEDEEEEEREDEDQEQDRDKSSGENASEQKPDDEKPAKMGEGTKKGLKKKPEQGST